MEDRREQILELIGLDRASNYPPDSEVVNFYKAKEAMDEYMKVCCLELLEYMAKNKIQLGIVKGEVECYLSNGEGISKEELFENFL